MYTLKGRQKNNLVMSDYGQNCNPKIVVPLRGKDSELFIANGFASCISSGKYRHFIQRGVKESDREGFINSTIKTPSPRISNVLTNKEILSSPEGGRVLSLLQKTTCKQQMRVSEQEGGKLW